MSPQIISMLLFYLPLVINYLQLISLLIVTTWVLMSQMRTDLVKENADIPGINCNTKQIEKKAYQKQNQQTAVGLRKKQYIPTGAHREVFQKS